MGREIRSIESRGRVVEIESRVVHGRYLMRPSPEVNELILGILGRAQAKYDIELFAFIFLSGHMHLILRAYSVLQMSYFVGFLKGNVARELGVLHKWREKFWGRRFRHAPVYDDEASQINRFRYVLRNSCKEGLVDSPLEWPGATTAKALFRGESELTGRWFDRTAQYRAGHDRRDKTHSSIETVRLTTMPFLAGRTLEQQRQFMVDAVRQVEEETVEQRRRDGRPSKGISAILRQHPHTMPKNFVPSPAPRFHAVTHEAREELREARSQIQIAYRIAAEKLKRGGSDVRFPEDCFPPRLPFTKKTAPT